MTEFSEWFDRLLTDRDLSLRGVARVVQVSPSTVRNWRTGETHPEHRHLGRLAGAIGVDLPELRDRAGYSEDEPVTWEDEEVAEIISAARELAGSRELSALLAVARSLRETHRRRGQ